MEGSVDIPATGAIGSRKERKLLGRGYYTCMQHNESRPSYLLVGLIEKSELRELLDEVYLDALQPAEALASI